MSHYADDYEFEEKKRRKRRTDACIASQQRIKELRDTLPEDAPKRFLGHLEDLENWLRANYLKN